MFFKQLAKGFLALALCSATYGQIVQWDVSGQIWLMVPKATPPSWLSDAQFGQDFEITFTTDLSQPPLFYLSDGAAYVASQGYAKVGSRSWVLDQDAFVSRATAPGNDGFFFSGTVEAEKLNFGVALNSSKHAGDVKLPLVLPPIDDFDIVRYLQVYSTAEENVTAVVAKIYTATISPISPLPVPEPSTYGLISAAAIFLLISIRRKNSQ